MKIVVIGGTGLIGSQVVAKLKMQGHDVVAASPNTGVNTVTGEGLNAAIAGAQIVVDLANSPSFEDQAAMDFFQTAGRNIVAAEVAAHVKHHVALSVVGTDRMQNSGYFRAKLTQEAIIKASPIPYTIVHATQFFEFLRTIAAVATAGDFVTMPPAPIQPMAAADVATAVAKIALDNPANGTVEIAGPEVFALDALVRKILAYDKDRRTVISDVSAPYFGFKLEVETALLPGLSAHLGSTTLDWWLANVPPPPKP